MSTRRNKVMQARAIVFCKRIPPLLLLNHPVEWLDGQSALHLIGSRCWITPARQKPRIVSAHVAAWQTLDAVKHLVARVREGGGDGVGGYHATLFTGRE